MIQDSLFKLLVFLLLVISKSRLLKHIKMQELLQFLNPLTSIAAGKVINAKVSIRNFGLDTLTSISVSYTIMANTVSEIWTGSLWPDSSVDYQFVATHISSNTGNIQLCTKISLPGDLKTGNDETCSLLTLAFKRMLFPALILLNFN